MPSAYFACGSVQAVSERTAGVFGEAVLTADLMRLVPAAFGA